MITVNNVSKNYRIYHSPADRLKEIVTRKKYHKDLKALSGISFTVSDGETLGIVGENGAGKSTLLKILQGVIIPDEGEVSVTGKVTGLLELGTGFNSELSGVENIYMNGTMLGMSREELDAKKDEIINFTELGDAIYDPIKTYSSGMLMRLGFSIAIHADPACFLVDEALSVGDAYFQQKCMRAIQAFKEKGGSIIFVSHDMNAVKVLCDSAIMLDKGNIVTLGSPQEVVDYYHSVIVKKSNIKDNGVQISQKTKYNSVNTDMTADNLIEITDVKILSENGEETTSFTCNETMNIKVTLFSHSFFEDPHYGFMIRNRLGQVIFETNTYCMGIVNGALYPDSEVINIIELPYLSLAPGDYSITYGFMNKGVGIGDFEEKLIFIHSLKIFNVSLDDKDKNFAGIYDMKPVIKTTLEKRDEI